jgi:hypothetical protein
VGAVADAVAVARAGEVLLDQRHPGEGRVGGVDAGIEDRHDHIGAGPGGAVGADRADAPGRGRRGVGVELHRPDQPGRHDRRQRPHPRVAGQGPDVVLGELLDLDARLARRLLIDRGRAALERSGRAGATKITKDHIRWHRITSPLSLPRHDVASVRTDQHGAAAPARMPVRSVQV